MSCTCCTQRKTKHWSRTVLYQVSNLLIYIPNIFKWTNDEFMSSWYIKSCCNINVPAIQHNQHFLKSDILQYLWFESATFGAAQPSFLGFSNISASVLLHIIITNVNSSQDGGKKQWWIKIPRLQFWNVLICSKQENHTVSSHLESLRRQDWCYK